MSEREPRKTRPVKRASFVNAIELGGMAGAHTYLASDPKKLQLALDGPFLMATPSGHPPRHVPLANVKFFEFEEE